MIPDHLEAYQVALIAWGFVLLLYGLQGLISVWLEGQELRLGQKGERASESLWAVAAILLLLGLLAFFAVRFVNGLRVGTTPAALAFDASMLFFGLAAMLVLYRRFFIADEVIVQDRDEETLW